MQLFEPGIFEIGMNYWESVHGTDMWRKWSPEIVDADLAVLEEYGVTLVRCFPLWADFQPIKFLRTPGGKIMETRFADESPLPDTEAGSAGVNEKMLEHFEEFCDLASRHHLDLIVCIMTSQMTFRLFTSPAMDGKDLYLDPCALKWEGKYLRYFVRRMKHHSAIRAWESGNESSCLGPVACSETAAFWMNYVNTVIRESDPSRPIIGVNDCAIIDTSGKNWLIQDVAEVSDVLSVHPYPMFDHSDREEYSGIRNVLNACSANRIQEHIGNRQSFIEETGVRRATSIDAEQLGAVFRNNLWNAWACGTHAYLWWLAFDQNHLDIPPYDWPQPTLELGIFKADRTPMPAAESMKRFRKFLDSLPFRSLPEPVIDAVCITPDVDIAKSADILAFMSGANLFFQAPWQPLRDAEVYLLPSICGRGGFHTAAWEALKNRIREGAVLYLSLKDCFLTGLEEVCGAVVAKRKESAAEIACECSNFQLHLPGRVSRVMTVCGGNILAEDAEGNPVFFRHTYGKGTVYTLAFELEEILWNNVGLYESDAWKIYSVLFTGKEHLLTVDFPQVLVSDHRFDDTHSVSLVRNCTDRQVETRVRLAPGWTAGTVWTDTDGIRFRLPYLSLPPETAFAVMLEKR